MQFRLSTGTITVPHMIAAGGDVQLLVSDEHWLHIVSGGLPDTTLAVGGQEFTLRELDVAMFQMVKLDVALLGRHIRTFASSLNASSAKLQECLDEGMPWTVLGSKVAAIACWVAWGRKCARVRPAQWLWGMAQMMALPPHTGADLPAEALFSDEITYEMLSTAEGAPRGAAAFRAVVPHGYLPEGRRSNVFKDSLVELVDAVELGRPGFGAMTSVTRQARAFSSLILRLMPADVPQLLICVPIARCFDAGSRYRLTAVEAFPMYFLDAFRAAFPNFAALVGITIDPTEAWGYVSQMLGKPPDSPATQALEASVGQLLPHLDTASLRAAPAYERVAEMHKLVRQLNADNGAEKTVAMTGEAAAGSEAISTLDSAAWARILQQSAVRAMLARLEPLNVTPLVEHRVVRVLLSDPAAIGMQIVTGKCKPVQATLRQMGAVCNKAAILLTFQRSLCVEEGILMLTWYEAISETAVQKLVWGKWNTAGVAVQQSVASSTADSLDWWADFAQPILLKKHGSTFLSSLTPLVTPADFFSDERRLRLGTPVLLEFFDMIGMSGTAVGSVASVLKSLRDTCDSVDNFPPRWQASATACRRLMVLAGVRFFQDAGLVWTQMLQGSTEHAIKPVLLAPPENGGHAHLADLRQILVDTKVHLRKEELLGVDQGATTSTIMNLSALTQGSGASSVDGSQAGSTISIGPSASVVGSQTSTLLSGSGSGISSALSNATTTMLPPPASQVLLDWGSLLNMCWPDGNGFWFSNVWSGPQDKSYELPPNTSPCKLMTNLTQQHKYCFHTPGSCTHTPLLGVNLVCSLAPMTQFESGAKEQKGRGTGQQLAAQKLQQQQQQLQNDSWNKIQKSPATGKGKSKGQGKGRGKGQGGKGSGSKGKGSKE